MDNKQAAAALGLLGDLIELAEDATFKARAYHGASRTIKGLAEPLSELVNRGTVGALPGFGKAMVEKVSELYATGKIEYLEELKATLPAGVIQMRKISGLGARKVRMLHREYSIDSLEALGRAAADGLLAAMPGFGPRTVVRIVESIKQVQSFEGQLRLPEARRISGEVTRILDTVYGEDSVSIAGDVRRHMPVVRDLCWVASGTSPSESIVALLSNVMGCEQCDIAAPDTIEMLFSNSVSGRVRVVSADAFGRAQLTETGPREFVAHVLRDAGDALGTEQQLICRTGMEFIPPECRDLESLWTSENMNALIRPDALKGVLHCHTNHSDGSASLAEMARAARDRGFTYIGICDHSPSASYAGGLTPQRVVLQHQEIDALNAGFEDGFRILKGTESDIRADGSLDYPDEILATFDFVVASIHSQIDMDEEAATDRICRALSNPYTTILGHPTARLLLKRKGYALEWSRVIETAAHYGVVIELNANPRRLDIDWSLLPACFEAGIITSINPDAHSTEGIDDMMYGVQIARKAGTTPDRVLNCMEQSEILDFFRKRHP